MTCADIWTVYRRRTPIRDVVDRCHVWESHADPAVCRIGKPNPDPTYPTYTVGDADSDNEVTRVAAVTGQRSESVGGLAPAGMSCLEPLEQSILHSSWIARPRKCVMKERSEWKPVINPAISYTLDGRPMEGTTYPEHLALGVSLDSRLTEGASCLEQLEQWVFSLSLAA